MAQRTFTFGDEFRPRSRSTRGQLLKWIGNKQRFAEEIAAHFPQSFNAYREPFLGSGAVLATVAPERGFASDAFTPLIEIWEMLRQSPDVVKSWYSSRWTRMSEGDKVTEYERVKANYNANPNGGDLLFLCRTCYGGVVRFRMTDGYMSTPCGPHSPVPPDRFDRRVDEWHRRTSRTSFAVRDYEPAMLEAEAGDLIYCDPPYSHSQGILYGAQLFRLENLFRVISQCKSRGVYVALSIDGTKKSGDLVCNLPIPPGLFEREVSVNCGRSMLKRFQMNGRSLESEVVSDRLLLTY